MNHPLPEKPFTVVLGAGLTGLSCARFLTERGQQVILLNEQPVAQKEQLGFQVIDTGFEAELVKQAEEVIISPGIRPTHPVVKACPQVEFKSDLEVFCRYVDQPIIAVTGTNGKSTTVSMIAHVLNTLGKKAALVGNIGIPVFDEIKPDVDYYVLECSSAQLSRTESLKDHIAICLNIAEDHLDWHQSLHEYTQSKLSIFRHAKMVITDSQIYHQYATSITSPVLLFGDSQQDASYCFVNHGDKIYLSLGGHRFIDTDELPLKGVHNTRNYLASLIVFDVLGYDRDQVIAAIKSFEGLPYRCQQVADHQGVTWINDSKATNMAATQIALTSFAVGLNERPNVVLIAGGDAKGQDLTQLIPYFSAYAKAVITYGRDGDQLTKGCQQTPFAIIKVKTLAEAVDQAAQQAVSGDVVLFSPACSSVDMFKNFMERGQHFNECVRAICDEPL